MNAVSWIRARLIRVKGLTVEDGMECWGGRELLGLFAELLVRAVRGCWVRMRMGEAKGLVLCQRGVRLYHPRFIHAGAGLSIQEGAEIVGLSRKGIRFGERCTVGRFATIRPTNVLFREPGEGLRMGSRSNIGPYAWIGCSGYVELGDNVMMGPRVSLLAENHNMDDLDKPMNRQGVTRGTIVIEDDCWLGAGCSVLNNVRIGRGSVVAAGAVVTRDVPPYSIVAGVPAQVVRSRRPAPAIDDN